MLLEVKTIKTNKTSIVQSEFLKMYLKWMEYIPEHWDIENILNKKASLLTKEEIQILKFINEENKYKDIIKDLISNNEKIITIDEDISKYLERMTIDKYALLKLTEDEIDYCENEINNCISLEDIEEYIDRLKRRKNRSLIDEYILFELEQKQIRKSVDEINSNIAKKVIENRKKELNGYEKCINTRNRF